MRCSSLGLPDGAVAKADHFDGVLAAGRSTAGLLRIRRHGSELFPKNESLLLRLFVKGKHSSRRNNWAKMARWLLLAAALCTVAGDAMSAGSSATHLLSVFFSPAASDVLEEHQYTHGIGFRRELFLRGPPGLEVPCPCVWPPLHMRWRHAPTVPPHCLFIFGPFQDRGEWRRGGCHD